MILYRSLISLFLIFASLTATAVHKKPVHKAKPAHHKAPPAHKPQPTGVLWVEGWQHPPSEAGGWKTPPAWLAEDPVLGRMSCPPLSRMLLKDKKSDPLLLRSVTSEDGGKLWRFTLRSGLYWWDGKPVTTPDLRLFIEANLSEIAKVKSGGLWQLPTYTVTEKNEGVEVRFSQAPDLGPYLFNGIPLWKSVSAPGATELPFQCVGTYKLHKGAADGDFTLKAVPKYGLHTPEIRITNHVPPTQKAFLSFRMAESLSVQPVLVNQAQKSTLELPWMTALAWNLKKLPQASTRKALAALLPRTTLLQAGAGTLGTLSASLLPPAHPAHRAQNRPITMPLPDAVAQVKKIQPPVERLQLAIQAEPGHIVEKVIEDAFLTAGIQVQWVTGAAAQEADGTLVGIFLPWPQMNLLSDLHSHAGGFSPLDPELDLELMQYARSTTQEKTDFQALTKIEDRWVQLEAITVIMQHKASVTGLAPKTVLPSLTNPDWFKQTIP